MKINNVNLGKGNRTVDLSDLTNLSSREKNQFFWGLLVASALLGCVTVFVAAVFSIPTSDNYDLHPYWSRWSWCLWLIGLAVVLALPLRKHGLIGGMLGKQVANASPFARWAPFSVIGAATLSGMPVWFVPLVALVVYLLHARRPEVAEARAYEPGSYLIVTAIGFVMLSWFYMFVGHWLFYSKGEIADGLNYFPGIGAFVRFVVESALTLLVVYLAVAHAVLYEAVKHNRQVVDAVRNKLKAAGIKPSAENIAQYIADRTERVNAAGKNALGEAGELWEDGFHAAVGYSHGPLNVAGHFLAASVGLFVSPFAYCWFFVPWLAEMRLHTKYEFTPKSAAPVDMKDQVIRGAGATKADQTVGMQDRVIRGAAAQNNEGR